MKTVGILALSTLLLFSSPLFAQAIDPASLYQDYCSVCHGDNGQGAIWASGGLSPPPANFTDPEIQQSLSRDRMINAVTHGRPGTAMTGWQSRLNKQEIATVVDYVITTFMLKPEIAPTKPTQSLAASGHQAHDHAHFDINLPFPDQLLGDLHRGARLYDANCATCHGKEGDGSGPRAYFINPRPRNFLHENSRSRLNRPRLFEAIGKGRLRTEMSAWEKVLSRQQIADIGEYVFHTFITP
ncbi:c-type cytochrome [Gammaproteobacteria bacterium]|nr:c-type cytochrome [Gammaproteobacteria bacterium]